MQKHQAQLDALVGIMLETYLADLDGALYGPVLSILDLLSKNQKTKGIFSALLIPRADRFFSSELHDRSHLTIMKGFMETSCFASTVSHHATHVLKYFELLLRDLSAMFSAPAGSVPLSEPIVECEFAAKILGSFVSCAESTLRPILSQKTKEGHHHPNVDHIRSLCRDLLRHMLVLMQSDQSPCNCIAPLGIAFVALFELHCDSLDQLIDAFFADLSTNCSSKKLIDDLLRLDDKQNSFATVFEKLASISQVSLHRGVLIVVPPQKLLHRIQIG